MVPDRPHVRCGPALALMAQMVEARSLDEYEALKPDVRAAAHLLAEVETLNQTRLDVTDVLTGRYRGARDVIDVAAFLATRVDAERRAAEADVAADVAVPTATFDIFVASSSSRRSPVAVVVEVDARALHRVVATLLARAHRRAAASPTTDNAVVVSYVGENADDEGSSVVRFRCRDTAGPSSADDEVLDATDDALVLGGSGLAAARLLCEAAGGYLRLAASREATVVDFALRGRDVSGDPSSYATTCGAHHHEKVSEANDEDSRESSSRGDRRQPMARSLQGRPRRMPPPPTGPPSSSPPKLAPPPQDDDDDGTLPDDVRVVIVEDSLLNRKTLERRVRRAQAGAAGWTYEAFATVEAARPRLAALAAQQRVLVTLDHDLAGGGGVLTGADALLWLRSIDFAGLVVSASGDDGIGDEHRALGADLAWGKPGPTVGAMRADLVAHFHLAMGHQQHQTNQQQRSKGGS